MTLRRIPFLILAIITLGLIAATVVEKLSGAATALGVIYLSPWMIALWTVLAATSMTVVWTQRKGMGFGSVMLHVSLVLILCGAAVTHFMGKNGSLALSVGSPASDEWILDSGEMALLPFNISLVDCGTEYHASAVAARDYFSIVDVDGEQSRISMNNVLDCRGYRFTQSSMGEGTSTLAVSYDVYGRGITFGAYMLLFVSMGVVLFGSWRFRGLLRKVVVPLLILLPGVAMSQPKALQRPLARSFGELYVVYGGRICPAQTVAKEFCSKVYGKDTYNGLTAQQVLTGWMYYYDDWKHEPFIKLRSKEARELLGKTYVSLSELFTRDGYALEPLLSSENPGRDLVADDEKVTFISSLVAGRLPQFVGSDSFEVSRMLEDVSADIATGHFRNADSKLRELHEYQAERWPDMVPSDLVFGSEILYNNTYYPLLAAIAAFMAGFVGALGLRRQSLAIAVTVLVYVTYVLALRWVIGGHIPMATGYETMLALAWFAALAAVVCARRLPVVLALGMVVCGAALMVAMMSYRNPAVSPLVPVLESRLLSLHVMLVMCSYAIFAIITLNSAAGLMGRADTDVSRLLLYPALFMLGAGIFVGAIWADRSWGRYWGWDPKETWALITFFIYALPFHDNTFPIFRRDRCLNIYLILAFLSVLMTYFGVNYLLGGLHSYGAS